jgi:mannitol-1-phosphate/altronate dehydrogenase
MKTIEQTKQIVKRPERVLQYGEGNFLRAFADWQIDILNEKTAFNGNVVAVQPRSREGGAGARINAQGGLYTTILRGLEGGRKIEEFRTIRSLSRCVNPYTQFDEYFACAENPELRFVLSNTTEAGIAYNPGEHLGDRPQVSFPGKLTALLYRRYEYFRGDPVKALVCIPCELIDRNGDTLRGLVERYAGEWALGEGFTRWLGACVFCNTLVDRIVSGFPGGETEPLWERLGYRDELLTAGELFYLWIIEKPPAGAWNYRGEFPLEEAGLKVIWTDDLEFYRTRKVRILNGAHSAAAPVAFLYGLDTVGQSVEDPQVSRFMRRAIFEEIIPALESGAVVEAAASGAAAVSRDGLVRFAEETLERFANPFINHQLLSISLNSVSKFKTRVLPSILSYQKKYGRAPRALCCSLAALIMFYRGVNSPGNADGGGEMEGRRAGEPYLIRDDGDILRRFAALWAAADRTGGYDVPDSPALEGLVRAVLGCRDWWGEDLNDYPGIGEAVTAALGTILKDGHTIGYADGMAAALKQALAGENTGGPQ